MTKPTIGEGTTSTPAPDGIVCGTIGNFVLISLASDELTMQWCAIGDASDWPTPLTDDARSKQAGSETFNGKYGLITGIVGNDFFGYVFQQKAITKATYVGGDIVFSFDTFEVGRGCFEYGRYVAIDENTTIFESEFGRHALSNGQVADIGHGITDDSYTPVATLEQKTVAVNPGIHTVFFEDGNLAYNYKTNQWTRQPAFSGRSYYSIDSATGVIGQVVMSGQAVDFQDSTGGSVQTATIETAERDLNQGGRALIDGVRPLVNGGTVAVSVGVRGDLDDSVVYSTGTSINSRTGKANFRGAANKAEGRYQRLKLSITGNLQTALGADVEFSPSGRV